MPERTNSGAVEFFAGRQRAGETDAEGDFAAQGEVGDVARGHLLGQAAAAAVRILRQAPERPGDPREEEVEGEHEGDRL